MKQAIHTWNDLNLTLRTAGVEQCKLLLSLELKGPRRKAFVFRIYSRFNKVRADNERQDLLAKLEGK